MNKINKLYRHGVNSFLRPKDRRLNGFGLVVRLQITELPFLNEFLDYYVRLGVDQFYLINTEPDNKESIQSALPSEFKGVVEIINKRPNDNLESSLDCVLPRVGEDFLLNVDMDEFLYLNGLTLQEFISQEGLSGGSGEALECRFKWVMSPLCDELYAPSIHSILEKRKFFSSGTKKSLASVKNVVKIKSHRFVFFGASKTIKYDPVSSGCFVFHVSARGIFDIVNKINFGKYDNAKRAADKRKELHELIFDPASKSLPARFVLVAFQNNFNDYLMSVDFKLPELRYTTDTKLLRKLTLDGLEKLLGVKVFKEDMDIVVKKINRYPIPRSLVKSYACGEINLLKVLSTLQLEEVNITRG